METELTNKELNQLREAREVLNNLCKEEKAACLSFLQGFKAGQLLNH